MNVLETTYELFRLTSWTFLCAVNPSPSGSTIAYAIHIITSSTVHTRTMFRAVHAKCPLKTRLIADPPHPAGFTKAFTRPEIA